MAELPPSGRVARQLPRTFIGLIGPRNAGLVSSTERARREGAELMEIAAGRDSMVTGPVRLARMLVGTAER